jgi:hypothetical protein
VEELLSDKEKYGVFGLDDSSEGRSTEVQQPVRNKHAIDAKTARLLFSRFAKDV